MNNNSLEIYKNDIKEEIRSRIDIAQVVGRYVKLKTVGQNLKGLCPFHKEKTPSFTVNPNRSVFHCFGCGKGGDIFTFIMEMEGLSFADTIKRLGDEAGVRVEYVKKLHPGSSQISLSKTQVSQVQIIACQYFYEQMKKNPEAIDYFKSRKLQPDIVKTFQLGYAPQGWTHFISYATTRNINGNTLAQCGLAIQSTSSSSQNGSFYDRFRHRIIFPIFDVSGKPIAFAGRTLEPDGKPKYLNSPETMLYKKNKILYGLHKSRTPIKEKGYAIIVEGYMDYLSLYQGGIQNVVATSGTAFTDEHAHLISRFTNDVVLVFDGDDAGFSAAEKAVFVLTPLGVNIRILLLPNKEDPDTFIQKYGADTLIERITKARDALHYLMERYKQKFDSSSVTGKSKIVQHFKPFFISLRDPILQATVIKKISEQLDIKEAIVHKTFQRKQRNISPEFTMGVEKNNTALRYLETEEGSFLHIIVKDPSYIKEVQKYITEEFFTDSVSKILFSLINNSYSGDQLLYNNMVDNSHSMEIKKIISLMLIKEVTSQDHEKDLSHKARRFLLKVFKQRKHTITLKIKNEQNPKIRVKLLDEQQKIITQYGELIKGW